MEPILKTLSVLTENLTTFDLGDIIKSIGGELQIQKDALTKASVNKLLVTIAALDDTNGTTSYDNKYVTITGDCSPPSATGLAAIVTLEGRGCTVQVNAP